MPPAAGVNAAGEAQIATPPARTPNPTAIATLIQPTPSATLAAAEEPPIVTATLTEPPPTGEPYPAPPEATLAPPPTSPPSPTPTLLPSPTPTQLASPTPSAALAPTDSITLTVSSLSPTLTPGERLILRWRIGAWSGAASGLRLEVTAPPGFTPLPDTPGSFDPASGRLSLPLASLEGDLGWNTPPEAQGPFRLQLDLFLDSRLLASRRIVVAEEGVSQVSVAGGTAEGFDGRVRLEFPPGAAAEALTVRVRRPAAQSLPPIVLSGRPIEVLAQGQTTAADIHQFSKPITVTLEYDPDALWGAEEDLRLYTYDPELKDWARLPSRVDTANHRLIGWTDHFSLVDFDVLQANRLPGLKDFQVSPSSGAATYALSLWTPPGPGGMQPSLTLSYNSQEVDSATAGLQAGWAGMGWSLDTGYIEPGPDDEDHEGTYVVSTAGVSGLLARGTDGYYHTTHESFWRFSQTSNGWTAWDKVGNQYFFEQSLRLFTANETEDGCDAAWHYWRWLLTRVRNIYGQEITYTYDVETSISHICKNPHIDREQENAAYPLTITYPNGRYKIVFDRTARTDYKSTWADTEVFQKSLLSQVRILREGQLIRRYVFTYDSNSPIFPNLAWSAGGKTPALQQVQEFGGDGSSSPNLPRSRLMTFWGARPSSLRRTGRSRAMPTPRPCRTT